MLRITDLSYTYPERDTPALSGVSLAVRPGECICISGHSGCGKSTLLLAIKGLLREGTLTGAVDLAAPDEPAGGLQQSAGIVSQNSETQILCATVAEEIAFGPENLCVPPAEIHHRIESCLAAVGLNGFGQRNVERMSAGQKQRLAIASVLAMNPRLLLLDEPTSQLDGSGKAELARLLKELKGRGYTLLIAEHNLEPFAGMVDRYILMKQGRIEQECGQLPPDFYRPAVRAAALPSNLAGNDRQPAIVAERLCLSYPDIGAILRNVSLSIPRGERLQIFGRNGSGKSSLLRCMAGALKADSGTLNVAGTRLPGQAHLLGKVGFLFQNPQRQLFENTVHEEVAFSLKRLRLADGEVRRLVGEALCVCEAEHLADRLPLSLSFGEQHRVALASVLAPQPEVLLLDEPFSGLDIGQRLRLLKILAGLREKYSTTVLIASHDPLPDPAWADRIVSLVNGSLEQ